MSNSSRSHWELRTGIHTDKNHNHRFRNSIVHIELYGLKVKRKAARGTRSKNHDVFMIVLKVSETMYNDDFELELALAEAYLDETMTFDLTKYAGGNSVYACLVPAPGETRRLLDAVLQTCPPFDPSTLRDEAHVTLVYSRHQGVDLQRLHLSEPSMAEASYTAQVVGVEYWEGHDKDGYAVLKLESEAAKALHQAFIAAGAKHSFDDYQAHMTICGKVGPRTRAVDDWIERFATWLRGQRLTIRFDRLKLEPIKGA